METAQLVAGLKCGDQDAWTALIDDYRPRLYRYIAKRIKDAHRVEDILQECWVGVFRNIGTFRGERFTTWLLGICANRTSDALRALYRAREEGESVEAMDHVTPDAIVAGQEERAAETEAADRAIQSLRLRLLRTQCASVDVFDGIVAGASNRAIARDMGAQDLHRAANRVAYLRWRWTKELARLVSAPERLPSRIGTPKARRAAIA